MHFRKLLTALSAILFIGMLCSGTHAQKKKKKNSAGDDYTPCTAKVNKESHVWVIVTVNTKGKVVGAEIAKSSGDSCMDQKGLQMAREQSYPRAEKKTMTEGMDRTAKEDQLRKFNVDMKVKPEDLQAPKPDAAPGTSTPAPAPPPMQ